MKYTTLLIALAAMLVTSCHHHRRDRHWDNRGYHNAPGNHGAYDNHGPRPHAPHNRYR